ncbi:hypothetical protein UK15_07830 [Streptomyces variegatus]|uniref:Uncharacterized protein n=1 Tax=Streptomyces variegatus TaxID=284040 RepID=A0A0M2GVS9_9ACTN|nr:MULTISPECIES: hypothetical protein [Streptomyces]KJK40250.1 hypothetical protein UK15_07830 [Streptomyces variegatus]
MSHRPTGPACGNNPHHPLTDGDRQAVADFKAYLADRAALRDRIAEALLDHLSRTADIRTGRNGDLAFMPEVTDAERMRIADAVLAVLPPPVSRADVLREAADIVGNDDTCDCGGCDSCVPNARAAELRRMADEAQPAPKPLLTLATPCAVCTHPYNWHQGGVCQAGAETNRCGCIAFAPAEQQDGAQR